ncbi:DUF6153 family protein [Streptomyces sp. E11-3]|uniref:DUF6153 family protein n=1 Tax=Streptomyces sp. E11-3 TaxID=3110112 RepID=UPI00397F0A4A
MVTASATWRLVLAALLLGLVTMHTQGHPAGPTPITADVQVVASHPHAPEAAGTEDESPAPDHGMTPATVCLAVLSAFALALLAAGRLPRPGAATPLAPRTRAAYTLRAPPARRTVLSRLSVLRI